MVLHLFVILFTEGGGFSVRGDLCPEGVSYQGDPPPLYSNVRVVRILLECTLVIIISGNSRCSPLLLHTNFTTDLLNILGLCTVSVH